MILITGGTGFIGRHLASRLAAEGQSIRLLSRHGRPVPGAEIRVGTVTDPASVTEAARGCEAVVHLAGIIRERGGQTFMGVHVRGTRTVIRACQSAGMLRLLHMSALGARANGRSAYHRTKWAAEELVRASGLDATIFRPSVAFGRGAGFVTALRGLVSSPAPIIPMIGRGLQEFQPIWVEDIVTCFARALRQPETIGQTYDLAGPARYQFRQLVALVAESAGVRKPIVHLPLLLARPAVAVLGRAIPSFPLTSEELTMLLEGSTCDLAPMTETFALAPASLECHLHD